MRKRMPCLALALILLFLLALPALAYSVPDDTTVYVTDTGSKYHREGCSYLKSSHPMTIKAAEAKHYEPCSRCTPDILTGIYSPGKGSSSSASSGSRSSPSFDPPPESEAVKSAPTFEQVVSIGSLVFCGGFIILITGYGAWLSIQDRAKERRKRRRKK